MQRIGRLVFLVMLIGCGLQATAFAGLLDQGSGSLGAAPQVSSIQVDKPALDIDVDINKGEDSSPSWNNPVWLAIGGVAVLLLVVLVAMAMRGPSSTVVTK